MSIFHINEFYCTSKFQSNKVSSKSFLIYGNVGNKEFLMVQSLSIFEFLAMKNKLFGGGFDVWFNLLKNSIISLIGVGLIIIGLLFRHLAMKTCGESFSHIITTQSRQSHKLITNGIYSISRHPSYVGVFYFAIGIQIFLGNLICLITCFIILCRFFKKRIEFEEWFLINRIFGQDYIDYKGKVGTLLPFIS